MHVPRRPQQPIGFLGLASAALLLAPLPLSGSTVYVGPNGGDWFNAAFWTNGVSTDEFGSTSQMGFQPAGASPLLNAPGAIAYNLVVAGTSAHLVVRSNGRLTVVGGAEASSANGGIITVDQGGQITSGDFTMGVTIGSSGTVFVDGPGSTVTANQLFVGYLGSGQMTVSNGGLASGNNFGVGYTINGTGTLNVTTGGTVRSTGPGRVISIGGGTPVGNSGIINIGTGAAPGIVDALEVRGVAPGGSTLNFNHNSASYTFAPLISGGTMQVRQLGTGTTVLTSANTYTGGTQVTGGALLVNNATGSGTGTGAVTVSNTGTILGGSGRSSGPVTVNAGAVLAPGASTAAGDTARLSLGNLLLGPNSVFRADLNTATPVSGHDQVVVTGTVNLTDSLLEVNAAPTLAPNDIIFLLLNDGTDPIVGSFAGLTDGATFNAGGWQLRVSYFGNGDAGPMGNDLSLTVVGPAAVPEPGTVAAGVLAGLALGAACGRRSAGRQVLC